MRRIGAALLSLAVFLAIWKLVTVIGGYPEFILPAPEVVAERAWRAIGTGILWEHTAVTLLEIVLGFTVGASAAIVTGTALGKSVLIERVLSPYIVAAQAVPILALAPLLDIWFGGGLLARVFICALIVFFPIAIATMVGIRSTDPDTVAVTRGLDCRREHDHTLPGFGDGDPAARRPGAGGGRSHRGTFGRQRPRIRRAL